MERDESPMVKGRRRAPGLILRGICMGTADVIPGVSGGTIALIMGIYDELVQTIAAIDQRVVGALLRGRIAEVIERLNATFLLPLLLGIGLAVLSLAKLITWLLTMHPQPVWGFFTGLILASAFFVMRQVEGWSGVHWGLAILGTAGGYFVTLLVPVETGTEGYKFVLAGMVAICAMILPGISGSFLLLVMGKYQQIFTAIHERDLTIIALAGLGALVGLLGFSRLLKRLLARFYAETMAFLVGLMLGSLRKIWPFRNTLEEKIIGDKVRVLRDECVWPQEFSGEVWLSFALMIAGVVLVLILEKLGRQSAIPEAQHRG